MKRSLFERLKKIENHTIKGDSMWFVHVQTGDRWTPYRVLTESLKEVERLDTMTGDAFLKWQTEIGKKALPFIDEEVFNETE